MSMLPPTRDFKAEITKIVTDETLTMEQRREKLVPFMQILLESTDNERELADAMDFWNNLLAEIVQDNNLRRH